MQLPAKLPTVAVPPRNVLWRVHRADHALVWFGPDPAQPPRHRFDAPGHEYGVCYFGDSPEAAIVETLIRVLAPIRVVARGRLAGRSLSQVHVRTGLRLAQLEGPGLVRLGLSANQVHADPYPDCQQLALALWRHPDEVDGIQYRSRWDNSRLCWAIFDRAAGKLASPTGTRSLEEPNVILPVLDHYDIGVV